MIGAYEVWEVRRKGRKLVKEYFVGYAGNLLEARDRLNRRVDVTGRLTAVYHGYGMGNLYVLRGPTSEVKLDG